MLDALATAFVMGLLGGLHCSVMCGPLVVGGCQARRDKLGYLAGRTTVYALAGALFGAIGAELTTSLEHLETVALLLLAASLILHGISLLLRRPARLVRLPTGRRPVIRFMARLLPRRGLGLGLVTGFLPCGVLAGAWLLAAATSDPLAGAGVMVVFASASAWGLFAPLLASRFVRPLFARLPPAAQGLAWCALGIFVAVRPFLMSAHHPGGH